MPLEQSQITELLHRWQAGDEEALDQLVPALYQRLQALAHQRLRAAPGERSLNTTGLVHEAYLRLVESPNASFKNRDHFLAVASRVMRNVLVDHARSRAAAKRGGGMASAELHDEMWIAHVDLDKVAELDEALKRLERLEPRQSRMVEQRYFGGLSLEETASALNVSLATVKRELRSARAWLAVELGGGAAS
jgi:RNA polymerase sigma factor (TIGR02999 family)